MTIKVEAGKVAEESTAPGSESKMALLAGPTIVRTVSKALFIETQHRINLTTVNRNLRGRRDPVLAATGELQERETA